jgi:hypothetical protein
VTEQRFVYADRDGVRRTLIADDERPGFVVGTEQDIEPVLEGIARDRELMRHGVNKLAARLPVPIAELFMLPEGGWDNDLLDRFLNSYEGQAFRVWKGRV